MSDNCNCCQDPVAPTPALVYNRPGLSAVAYRIGVYGSFRQSMLRAISRQAGLQSWTTRRSDDFGIALLEMWAYVADILTFYQERIANEAYLPTATQRSSVMRLARFLGYQPANGVAASAYLAYTVDQGKQVAITARMRVQSVPEKKEDTPQKFESVESLTADWRLNQVRIFPQPLNDTPLAAGRLDAFLSGDAGKLAAGNKLVFYQTGLQTYPPHLEEKAVSGLKTVDSRQVLSWEPAIRASFGNSAHASVWRQKFRLFGHSAPASFYVSSVVGGEIVWATQAFNSLTYIGSSLTLDGVYSEIKENSDLLLVFKDSAGNARVEEVVVVSIEQGTAQIPASGVPIQQSTVTILHLNRSLNYSVDVRSAVVYLLEGLPLQFWPKRYAVTLSGSQVYIPLELLGIKDPADPALKDLQTLLTPGRRVILEDAQSGYQAARLTAAALESGHLRLTLDPAIQQALDSKTALLRGNVALATHGETIASEVLGSGSAAAVFQSFKLKKSPLTYIPQAGSAHGAASTLEVWANQVLWKESVSLFGASPVDHVYTLSTDDSGSTSVRFGDGVQGARLPTGRDNVTARYRQGIGVAGNVTAKTLRTALDKPTGLKEVTNPHPAEGGADPETLDQARVNAPNTVRTFDRIVSLRDFEDAARSFTGIAKARADWHWDGFERAVRLTVAGDGGAVITPGSIVHTNLVDDLDSRRDPNRKLSVLPHTPVAVQVKAVVQIDSTRIIADILTAVQSALDSFLAFDHQALGQSVNLSDVYAVLQAVSGVVFVDINTFQYKHSADRSAHGVNSDPLQAHLRIFPNELLTVENSQDLEVKNN